MRIEASAKNVVRVDTEGELWVCLCEKTCEQYTNLRELQEAFPGLRISIREDQLGAKEPDYAPDYEDDNLAVI